MSELFSWFKKADAERRQFESTHVFDGNTGGAEAPSSEEPTEVVPMRAAVPSRVKFDLDLADHRIKTVLDPRTLPGEQFRFLRARLGQIQRRRELRKLLITSSVPGEGKTFTACCLAGILAQEPGKRVLLIDADLRKPRAAANLGVDEIEEPGGLSHLLQGTVQLEEVLLGSSTMDFYFLPAGPVPENPSELLASNHLEQAMQGVTDLFDWIVVDSPPVLTLADPTRLAPLCDGVLLVVQANKTSAKMIQKAIQMLGKDLVCGVVMNRVKDLNSSRYYYHYYGGNGRTKK